MSSNVISVVSAKLKGDRQAVTAKWVSTTQNVSADEAKRALEAVYSANNDSVGVIYMVTGIAANMAVKVQLVSAANLDAHCSKLTRVVSKTVYALYPATEATPSPDAEKAALYNAWSLSNVEQRAMYLSGDIMAANSLRTNSSSAITNTSVTRSRGAFALPTVSAPPVVSVSNAFDAVSGSSVLASARRQPSIASAFSKGTSPAAAVASPAATGSAPLAKSTSAGIKGMFAAAAAATPAVASPAPVAAAASSPVKKALSWGSDSSSTTPPASGGFGFSLGDDPFGDTPVLTKRKGAAVAARKPAGGARGRKGGAKTEGMSDFVAADGEESGSGGDNSAGEEEEDEETFVRRTTEVVAAARRAATALDDDDEDDYDERKIRAAKQAEMRRAAIAAHDESDSDDDAAAVAATTAASVTDKGGRKKSSKSEVDAEVQRQWEEEEARARKERAAASAAEREKHSLARFVGTGAAGVGADGKRRKWVDREVTRTDEDGFEETVFERVEVTDDEADAPAPAPTPAKPATAAPAAATAPAAKGSAKGGAKPTDEESKKRGGAKEKEKDKLVTKSIFSFFKKVDG